MVLNPKLSAAAARRVATIPRLVGEESDFTSKSLHGFLCNEIRSPEVDLTDVGSVWRLLRKVATRHINDVARNRLAQKRGGLVATTSLNRPVLRNHGEEKPVGSDYHVADILQDRSAVDPSQSVIFDEFVEHLQAKLDDERARQIVLMRLGGCSNGEIADLMRVSVRTIQRQIKEIEEIWMKDQGFREILGDQE